MARGGGAPVYVLLRQADPGAGPCLVSFCRRPAGERVSFMYRGEILLVTICSRCADFAELGGDNRYRERVAVAVVDTPKLPWVASSHVGPLDLGR